MFYVMSLGPVCWVTSRAGFGAGEVSAFYRPIAQTVLPHEPLVAALKAFAEFGADRSWHWVMHSDPHGKYLFWGEIVSHIGPGLSP